MIIHIVRNYVDDTYMTQCVFYCHFPLDFRGQSHTQQYNVANLNSGTTISSTSHYATYVCGLGLFFSRSNPVVCLVEITTQLCLPQLWWLFVRLSKTSHIFETILGYVCIICRTEILLAKTNTQCHYYDMTSDVNDLMLVLAVSPSFQKQVIFETILVYMYV